MTDAVAQVEASPEVVDAVLQASSFDAMAQRTAAAGDASAESTSRFRSGRAGAWSKMFTVTCRAGLS